MTSDNLTASTGPRLGLLWRGNPAAGTPAPLRTRLGPVFEALEAIGVATEAVVYADEVADSVRAQLLDLDGVLAWVDPITNGEDRSVLDPLLREVSAKGVWVSAHPDVIMKMGTKEVLYQSRHLGWGTDTHIYRTLQELRRQLAARLEAGEPRVLKQHRGNGGIGVWKVEAVPGAAGIGQATLVRVLHALQNSVEEEMPLGDFVDRCEPYFAGAGLMVDQPFQGRLADGMIRCYLVQDRVAGFGHQLITALLAAPAGSSPANLPQPGPRVMSGPDDPAFGALRTLMESEWVPALQQLLDIETAALPAIWDADFLYGPKTPSGEDTYVLCEINVSAVFPFPDDAVEPLAAAAARCVFAARTSRT
jgi:hypothetical protein